MTYIENEEAAAHIGDRGLIGVAVTAAQAKTLDNAIHMASQEGLYVFIQAGINEDTNEINEDLWAVFQSGPRRQAESKLFSGQLPPEGNVMIIHPDGSVD